MALTLSPRDQRLAALGLLALVLVAAYGLLVHSWFTGPWLALNERMDALGEQQQRYTALLGQRASLQRRAQQARANDEDVASLLPGNDSSAAAADLMQRVSDQVKRLEKVGPGCVVVQRMPIIAEPVAQSPYRAIKLSLGLECAIEPLTGLLHGLEYSRPVLRVDQLDIARARQGQEQTAGGRLTVHLLITGYMAAGEAAVALRTGPATSAAQGAPASRSASTAQGAPASQGAPALQDASPLARDESTPSSEAAPMPAPASLPAEAPTNDAKDPSAQGTGDPTAQGTDDPTAQRPDDPSAQDAGEDAP